MKLMTRICFPRPTVSDKQVSTDNIQPVYASWVSPVTGHLPTYLLTRYMICVLLWGPGDNFHRVVRLNNWNMCWNVLRIHYYCQIWSYIIIMDEIKILIFWWIFHSRREIFTCSLHGLGPGQASALGDRSRFGRPYFSISGVGWSVSDEICVRSVVN